MTTYDAKGMPQFATSDKIAAPGDGLREDLNLISASATAAITAEGGRAESAAKSYADSQVAADRNRLTAIESKNTTQDSRLGAVESKNIAQDNTLSNYGPRISATESKNTAQDSTLSNHETRVKSLETLGGLAPGNVSDATVTDLIANAGTTTAGQLGAFVANKSAVVVAPKPSGADDTAALNALFAANAGKVVSLPAGATYKISGVLTVQSNTNVEGNGATIDATALPTSSAFGQITAMKSTGSIGAARPITSAIAKWSRTLTGVSDTSGLAPGDMVVVSNDEVPVLGLTRSGNDRFKGEINLVSSVDAATVTLAIGVMFDYAATGLKIQKVTPVENLKIRGLSMKLGGVGKGHNALNVKYGRFVDIEMNVDGAEDIAINLSTVLNGKVRKGDVRNSTSPSFTTSGYGVNIVDGSRGCLVENMDFYNCRHFVAGGGYWPASFIKVKDCTGTKSLAAAYDCHESSFHWTFEGNIGTGVFNGFGIRGQYVTVKSNEIYDCTGNAYDAGTVDKVTEQRSIRFIKNIAHKVGGFGISADGKAAGTEPNCLKIDFEASGNELRDCGTDSLLVRHFDGAKLTDNRIYGALRHAILALGLSAGTPSKGLDWSGNLLDKPGGNGIQAQFVDGITSSGGMINSPALYGAEYITCNRTRWGNVNVNTPVRSGLYVNGGADHEAIGGGSTGGTDANYDAFRSSGASDVTVSSGRWTGARGGVIGTGGDGHVFVNNNTRGTLGATKVSSDATNKVVANNL